MRCVRSRLHIGSLFPQQIRHQTPHGLWGYPRPEPHGLRTGLSPWHPAYVAYRPRWKDLKIYKFSGKSYPHIDAMFTADEINVDLIAKHLVDMLRVAVSILEGRISPSFIRRRLTSGTRKNKLFYAFQELGKVVRSAYLLKYLRATLNSEGASTTPPP
jgi:hypothetical protein